MSTTSTTASELIHLSPNDIEIEENVRLDPRLEGDFLDSIAQHGVLVPVLAVRIDGHDTPLVREGQRRVQAARQVGLASVPVYVRTVEGPEKAVRAQRVMEQIVTNDHRAPLTPAERARGINQLLLDGVSPTKVAKGLSTTKEAVAAARAAVDSARAMSALDTGQLSLEEAAQFAEFDGDDEAQAVLLRFSGTEQFAHRAAQLRADREERQRRAEAGETYAALGYTVLDRIPGWLDREYVPSEHITDDNGQRLTDEQIAALDPKHWAVWMDAREAFLDAETGESVDEEAIDFETADDPELEPAEGLRHYSTVVETTMFVPEYYCLDPQAAGVKLTEWAERRFGADANDSDVVSDSNDPDAAAERERARQERERAERRRVLALNRLGAAAETVRREWVRDRLLARKSAPAGTALYLAQVAVTSPELFHDYHGQRLTAELLGLADKETPRTAVEKLSAASDARALLILLAMVLAAAETRTLKDAWRSPQELSKTYLHFLEDNGYPLSDIEQVIIGARNADDVYRDHSMSDEK